MAALELTFVRQPGEHYCYHCKPGHIFSIGRGSDCDIRVLDFHMSRHHADLEAEDEQWYVTCQSAAGELLLNDQHVERARLAEGDRLTIGQSLFTVERIRPAVGPDPHQ
jgi:pSer/pThr/pTyr-binding forkhead associated (FHA) protein